MVLEDLTVGLKITILGKFWYMVGNLRWEDIFKYTRVIVWFDTIFNYIDNKAVLLRYRDRGMVYMIGMISNTKISWNVHTLLVSIFLVNLLYRHPIDMNNRGYQSNSGFNLQAHRPPRSVMILTYSCWALQHSMVHRFGEYSWSMSNIVSNGMSSSLIFTNALIVSTLEHQLKSFILSHHVF
jgi:hypothetical protein